ncbi:MAG: integrin alpha [Promethearchaeia archaeon]
MRFKKKNFAVIFMLLVTILGITTPFIQQYNIFSVESSHNELLLSSSLETEMNISLSNFSLYGEQNNSNFGRALTGIGDVNGDGYDDFIISAPYFDTLNKNNVGKVYLFFGNSSWNQIINCSNSDASFIGEYENNEIGNSIAGAGDVNGDGYDDFLIGTRNFAISTDNNVGKVYLFLGKETGWSKNTNCSEADGSFIGEAAKDDAGSSLSGAGDVNKDGYDDFLIGADSFDNSSMANVGKVYLFLGKDSGWGKNTECSNANASFIGEKEFDKVGYDLADAGDVNDDGYNDFLFSSTKNSQGGTDAGKIYLILGKETEWQKNLNCSEADASFIGEASGDLAGWSIDGAGDINGDNFDDIIIGAPSNRENKGKTYVFFGKESSWGKNFNCSNADASFIGERDNERSGTIVSKAGKFNNDRYNDFLIAAPLRNETLSYNGKIYLIYGKSAGWDAKTNLTEADASFYGENENDFLGQHRSVAYIGDINGDNSDDILIAADYNDEYGKNTGKAYTIFGSYSPKNGAISGYPSIILIQISAIIIAIIAVLNGKKKIKTIN